MSQATPNTTIKKEKKRINEPMKKWANELNRTFSKEEVQMAKDT
jgi:hypothetical protein